jgi:hypothetical protein
MSAVMSTQSTSIANSDQCATKSPSATVHPRRLSHQSHHVTDEGFREMYVGDYKGHINNGVDVDFLSTTRLENGETPTTYLQAVYDKFNISQPSPREDWLQSQSSFQWK